MNEIFFILLLLALSFIQTVVGVGILLLGTPIMLLYDFNIIEAINVLLPFSILTSLSNLFFLNNKKYKKLVGKEKDIINFFFLYCLPGVLIGTIALQFLNPFLNYKLIVSFLIIISVIIKNKFSYIFIKVKNKIKIFLMTIIGLIHGLTNSGGSLLSLFVLSFGNNKDVISTRYNITYFYFYLALTQYVLFKIIFYNQDVFFFENYIIFFLIIIFGCILGNWVSKFINKKFFNFMVDILAIFTAINLLLK